MSQNRSGTTQYLAPDDRENIRLVLSGAGSALDNNQYKAFLELLNTPTQVNPYLGWGNANGRLELPGYIRTGARILVPVWGRWLSPDAIGFAGGDWNLYNIVRNNLIRRTDPSGKYTIADIYDNQTRGQVISDIDNYLASPTNGIQWKVSCISHGTCNENLSGGPPTKCCDESGVTHTTPSGPFCGCRSFTVEKHSCTCNPYDHATAMRQTCDKLFYSILEYFYLGCQNTFFGPNTSQACDYAAAFVGLCAVQTTCFPTADLRGSEWAAVVSACGNLLS